MGGVRGFLFLELGFATLAQRLSGHWIHFVKEAFSDLCPEISSSKIGGFWHSSQFWLQDIVVDYLDLS